MAPMEDVVPLLHTYKINKYIHRYINTQTTVIIVNNEASQLFTVKLLLEYCFIVVENYLLCIYIDSIGEEEDEKTGDRCCFFFKE